MILTKNVISVFLLAASFFMLQFVAFGQASFEGIISLTSYNQEVEENAEIKWYVKESNYKLSISGNTPGHAYSYDILLNTNDPGLKMITKQDGQTTVFNIPAKETGEEAQKISEVIRTDETKSVAGYDCRKVSIIGVDSKTTCWISDEIALSVTDFPGWLKSNPVYSVLNTHGITGFPMEMETISAEGVLLNSIKVDKVVSTKLNPSEFELPASYIDGEKAIRESFEPK